MTGEEQVDVMIDRLLKMPELVRRSAPDVAEVVERDIKAKIHEGRGPYGEKWQPKQDGGQPLETADKNVRVAHVGTRVIARVDGHIARHHLGTARGGIERQILPDKSIPPTMVTAIRNVLIKNFQLGMGA